MIASARATSVVMERNSSPAPARSPESARSIAGVDSLLDIAKQGSRRLGRNPARLASEHADVLSARGNDGWQPSGIHKIGAACARTEMDGLDRLGVPA